MNIRQTVCCVALAVGVGLAPVAAGADDADGTSRIERLTGASAPGDDLEKLLEGLSPEAVNQLIRTAIQSRLTVERKQAVEEMREDLLLDPEDIDRAAKALNDKPKNTQKDNIERILRAFAVVDPRFGKALKLLEAKKYAAAAATIEKDLNVQEATYRNAGRYTIYARALAGQKKPYDAVEAYQKVLVAMADRISFAAAAAMDSARIYDEMHRYTYAAQMYSYAVTNYGLALDEEALKLIEEKVKEYSEFGDNPLAWAGTMMADVKQRLETSDSGTETQAKEDRIVAVITDMIKTAEEQQRSGQQGQGCKSQQKKKRQGEGSAQGQGKGGKKGPPKGTNQPSSPARVSALVPGAVARPTKRSDVRDTAEIGDWANLPPRERQRLQQLRKKVMSERYRGLIGKYRTKISQGTGGE